MPPVRATTSHFLLLQLGVARVPFSWLLRQLGIARPLPDIAHPLPDIAHPLPDIAHPLPDIAHPLPDIAHPLLDVARVPFPLQPGVLQFPVASLLLAVQSELFYTLRTPHPRSTFVGSESNNSCLHYDL
ncbi:hypothetical protein EDD15DRAFT_2255796 [Pisolithus albus]|nr:hypothetical protein EDD15DRAFT_2255796 [Pisolithus albus]